MDDFSFLLKKSYFNPNGNYTNTSSIVADTVFHSVKAVIPKVSATAAGGSGKCKERLKAERPIEDKPGTVLKQQPRGKRQRKKEKCD
ncbi:hypothetical protein T11_11087 [Trichinella zimbabwensis]|uniref:Uncharacterized protein n=1 Tax=Trichinella zimbabwensis TaxID=268475 RepID=A0A0V1HLU0_9BILA|nr:hypothetical protein T11_11087 [Trichinella zimbabwensis]